MKPEHDRIIDESLAITLQEDEAKERAYWAAMTPDEAGEQVARVAGYDSYAEMEMETATSLCLLEE